MDNVVSLHGPRDSLTTQELSLAPADFENLLMREELTPSLADWAAVWLLKEADLVEKGRTKVAVVSMRVGHYHGWMDRSMV